MAKTTSAPTGTRVISDAAGLKALSDPIRLRVFHLLMRHAHRSWTVKEIAAEIGQPATKLYHHVKLLEQAELIRDVETRVVSGIVEHRYQTAQRSLQFDDALFGSPATRDDSIAHTAAVITECRDEYVDYLSRPDADTSRMMLAKGVFRLSAADAQALHEHLETWFDDLQTKSVPVGAEDSRRLQLLMLLHPTDDD